MGTNKGSFKRVKAAGKRPSWEGRVKGECIHQGRYTLERKCLQEFLRSQRKQGGLQVGKGIPSRRQIGGNIDTGRFFWPENGDHFREKGGSLLPWKSRPLERIGNEGKDHQRTSRKRKATSKGGLQVIRNKEKSLEKPGVPKIMGGRSDRGGFDPQLPNVSKDVHDRERNSREARPEEGKALQGGNQKRGRRAFLSRRRNLNQTKAGIPKRGGRS